MHFWLELQPDLGHNIWDLVVWTPDNYVPDEE